MVNTLELMIEDIYKDYGYMYNENTIRNVAEYIENYNANKPESEGTMTPRRWYNESVASNPEDFITKEQLYTRIAIYLDNQRNLCIDQTGCQPCYIDWKQEMECDEYKHTIGEWADTVTITDFLNWLLDMSLDNISRLGI